MTQNDQILSILQSGRTISQLDVIPLGIFRLSARIYDLQEKGYKIKSLIVRQNNKNFAIYRLEQ